MVQVKAALMSIEHRVNQVNMSDTRQYIETLFMHKRIDVALNRKSLFEEFMAEEANVNAVKQIQENQKMIMDKWALKNRIRDIIDKQLIIPNGTISKPYEARLDIAGMSDIAHIEFDGLEKYGLAYNSETRTIKGNPTQSGDFRVKMKFRMKQEPAETLHDKPVSLVINADPKSLWKNIPSANTENNYWKPDQATAFEPFGSRHIVVASKRGRSHANVGSFRDDDFAFRHFENGWSIVCVADGAGSAKLSRQGSKIACDGIIEFFADNLNEETQKNIDDIVARYHQLSSARPSSGEEQKTVQRESVEPAPGTASEIRNEEIITASNAEPAAKTGDSFQEVQKELKLFLYNNLGKAAFSVHKKLEDFARTKEINIRDLHSTLIFTLHKKYEFGYAILSFGVGDCPIGLLNRDVSEIKLMNWLDVGEFGGGTRFITMPEIFSNENFSTRFGFKLVDDFSYLMLMTDGIYDPKFVVEANLEKVEKWREFIADLEGNNEDKARVELDPENKEIAEQLSAWMDFWSPGNHDDRTLAIVF
jgi:hypothetical protein